MSFVDETDETRSCYTSLVKSSSPTISQTAVLMPLPLRTPPAVPETHHLSPLAYHPYPDRSHSFSSAQTHSFSSPYEQSGEVLLSLDESLRGPSSLHDAGQDIDSISDFQDLNGASASSPAIPFDEVGRVSDVKEAFLLRHFISIGVIMDVCDPDNHFGSVVPELATSSALLVNAVLAASALHLSRTTDYDPMVAEMYHKHCVELLIPLLDDPSRVADEVVAATVLLRFFEQVSSAITGSDCERHLSGTSPFMNSEKYCATASGLRQAAFWIFIRQDIDVAIGHQRPLKLNMDAYSVEIDLDMPTEDWG